MVEKNLVFSEGGGRESTRDGSPDVGFDSFDLSFFNAPGIIFESRPMISPVF